MIKTLFAFAGMFFVASTAVADDTFKVENVPPVVQQLGQPSGLFPHVNRFFQSGPITVWARRPTNQSGDTRDN